MPAMLQCAPWGATMPMALRSKPREDITNHLGTNPSKMASLSPQ